MCVFLFFSLLQDQFKKERKRKWWKKESLLGVVREFSLPRLQPLVISKYITVL